MRATEELKERELGPKRTTGPSGGSHVSVSCLAVIAHRARAGETGFMSKLTILLMETPKIQVTVAFPGAVQLVPVGEFGYEGSRVLS